MGIFLAGSIVQTIILINNENYGFPAYQGSLLALAVLALCYVGNVYGSKILPHWQNALFVLHMLSYLAYIVPIWVNAPSATHYQVWGEFQNEGGWSNMALAVLAGQLTGISEQVGIDTVSTLPNSRQALVLPTDNLLDSTHGRGCARCCESNSQDDDDRLCPQHGLALPCHLDGVLPHPRLGSRVGGFNHLPCHLRDANVPLDRLDHRNLDDSRTHPDCFVDQLVCCRHTRSLCFCARQRHAVFEMA